MAENKNAKTPADDGQPMAWRIKYIKQVVLHAQGGSGGTGYIDGVWHGQPQKKEWVGLTDEEVSEIINREIGFNSCWGPEEKFARAIEAKLKEKNHG